MKRLSKITLLERLGLSSPSSLDFEIYDLKAMYDYLDTIQTKKYIQFDYVGSILTQINPETYQEALDLLSRNNSEYEAILGECPEISIRDSTGTSYFVSNAFANQIVDLYEEGREQIILNPTFMFIGDRSSSHLLLMGESERNDNGKHKKKNKKSFLSLPLLLNPSN